MQLIWMEQLQIFLFIQTHLVLGPKDQQQLDQAQQGVKHITDSVLDLEQRYQQTHQHLTAIELGTTEAYQQMSSIETAGQTLLKATAETQQQLGRFGRRS